MLSNPCKCTEPAPAVSSPVESETQRMLRMIREPKLGLPQIRESGNIVVELTNVWTEAMLVECLKQGRRTFYYDLRHSAIAEARDIFDQLATAKVIVNKHIGLSTPLQVNLLLGLNPRSRHLGQFCDRRQELHLRQGARFILTTDRRMCRRGCRLAAYCNCQATLAHIMPNVTIQIGNHPTDDPVKCANVALIVRQVCGLNIVCRVQQAGTIHPGDLVHLPVSSYDTIITQECIDNVQFALDCQALAIVTPEPRNETYLGSLRAYVHEQLKCIPSNSLGILTHLNRVHSRQQLHFISSAYDGVMFQLSAERVLCEASIPIMLTQLEVALVRELHLARKLLLIEVQQLCDSCGESEAAVRRLRLPKVTEAHADLLHFYADGFVAMCPPDIDTATYTEQLYRFMWHLASYKPVVRASAVRHIAGEQFEVDATRSGRRILARTAVLAAHAMQAAAIIVSSRTGRTTVELSKLRPPCLIVQIIDGHPLRENQVQLLSPLHRNVRSVVWLSSQAEAGDSKEAKWHRDQDNRLLLAIFTAVQNSFIRNTDRVIVVCRSEPLAGTCNTFHTCDVPGILRSLEAKL